MGLAEYRGKRKFHRTPEPAGKDKSGKAARGPLRFVVQKHAASRVHFDLRLELGGVYLSWAVPKGPSMDPMDQRLAVKVEDHPLEYGTFEGIIPAGNYGAGTVMLWDEGTYEERSSKGRRESEAALRKGLEKGHLTFVLSGRKLSGEFALVRLKKAREANSWLLVKKRDEAAVYGGSGADDRSVKSRRTMEQIAAGRDDVWLPGKGRVAAKDKAAAAPKAEPPHRIRPMQAIVAPRPPDGDGWLYEPFHDGVRAVAEVGGGKARVLSRDLLPLDAKYPAIVKALGRDLDGCVVDGEIAGGVYWLSDLLYADGRDLRELPLAKRRHRLEARKRLGRELRVVEAKAAPHELDGAEFIVAKRAKSPYRSGLSRDWIRFRAGGKGASPTVSGGERPPLTHLGKVYFPDDGYRKGDIVAYYEKVAEVLVPHLVDRPQSLHRQPNGLRDEGFFHKDIQGYVPKRIEAVRIDSGSSGKTINYVLCQDKWSLLYLANLGCIELNPWLSRRGSLDTPDWSVIDLDPDDNPFEQVVEAALEVQKVLERLGVESWVKTSGATGLHILVKAGPRATYAETRAFAEAVVRVVHERLPDFTSLEREPARRRGKIYLDFLQNRRGATLAAPYCVRPRPGATVSAPLRWAEVKRGLDPAAFTIETMPRRIAKVGDLWSGLLKARGDLAPAMKQLSKLSHGNSRYSRRASGRSEVGRLPWESPRPKPRRKAPSSSRRARAGSPRRRPATR